MREKPESLLTRAAVRITRAFNNVQLVIDDMAGSADMTRRWRQRLERGKTKINEGMQEVTGVIEEMVVQEGRDKETGLVGRELQGLLANGVTLLTPGALEYLLPEDTEGAVEHLARLAPAHRLRVVEALPAEVALAWREAFEKISG